MSRFHQFLVVALAALLVACGGTPATASDPYELAAKAADAKWERVQIRMGLEVEAAGTAIEIEPNTNRLVIDEPAGKGLFSLSLPADAIGADGASLLQLGIAGNIELDVLFDGDAVYAKSPIAATVLPLLLAQTGGAPSGDLGGWLKLGSKSEFEALAALGGGQLPDPESSAIPDLGGFEAAELKTLLEDGGVTLTHAGSEQRNGVDADHVTVAVDFAKLAASEEFSKFIDQVGGMGAGVPFSPTDLNELTEAAGEVDLGADLWFDKSAGRIVELGVHFAKTGTDAGTMDFVLTFAEPDAGTSLDAPADAVELPLSQLLPLLMSMGGGF